MHLELRFSVVMDIKPSPGIHVYAAGAKGYRPIALIIAPQANVRVLPVQYPPSQIYFFKPLKERVPVFRKPFTLVREVILEGTPQAQAALRGKETLTLTGTLDYQRVMTNRGRSPGRGGSRKTVQPLHILRCVEFRASISILK